MRAGAGTRGSGRPPRRRRLRRLLQPILRPGVGHLLPPELAPRRIGVLAAALPTGVRGPELETLLRRVEAKPVHPGNQIETYHTGEAAFAAMYEAVAAAARHEVLLESYIFKDDAVGHSMLDQLSAAAGRGVAVRVLADALGSLSTHAAFWRDMERRGIAAHLFNPLFKGLWYQPFRDHRKLLIVDRSIAFTGGMNIGVEYGSPTAPGGPWRDSHVRVAGPAAWGMAIVFNEGWAYTGGPPIDLPPLAVAAPELPGARVLVLDARPLRGNREAAAALVAIAAAARHRPPSASSPPPPAPASTSVSSSPAAATCRSSATPATATSPACSAAACASSSTRPPSCTPSPWSPTAISPWSARPISTFVPSSSTPSATWWSSTSPSPPTSSTPSRTTSPTPPRSPSPPGAAAPSSTAPATGWPGCCRRCCRAIAPRRGPQLRPPASIP